MKNWDNVKNNDLIVCSIDGAINRVKILDGKKCIVGIRDAWPVEEFNPQDWDLLDLPKTIRRLNEDHGWSLEEDAHEYTIHDGILAYEDEDTLWEIDILTGESRHKGRSLGCFWTEWEG